MKVIPSIDDWKKARKYKLKQYGIVYPVSTVWAARKANIPLAYACAMLQNESLGGLNVFGHDPVRSIVGGKVTKSRYLYYLKRRKQGLGCQGVGPTQLTWYGYQDEADKNGGCWRASINMYTGFTILDGLIRQHGLHDGAALYNGVGPAANAYGDLFVARVNAWQKRFAAIARRR